MPVCEGYGWCVLVCEGLWIELQCRLLGIIVNITTHWPLVKQTEMAYMFLERHNGLSSIDYPLGGSKGIVDALARGE